MLDKRITLEEKVINEEYETITLYFIAPLDILDGKYPEAEHAEISVEFPFDLPEAGFATVMFSPTKDGEDYDWFDADISYDQIDELIELGLKGEN